MYYLYILHKRIFLCLILICAMLIYNKNSLSQPFSSLINKILLQDESINSSKTLIKKNRNDLSSIKSLYTPKLNLIRYKLVILIIINHQFGIKMVFFNKSTP